MESLLQLRMSGCEFADQAHTAPHGLGSWSGQDGDEEKQDGQQQQGEEEPDPDVLVRPWEELLVFVMIHDSFHGSVEVLPVRRQHVVIDQSQFHTLYRRDRNRDV